MSAAPVEAPALTCGHVRSTGAIEWICTRAPHPDPPRRKPPTGPGSYPLSEQHHFVRRYPQES